LSGEGDEINENWVGHLQRLGEKKDAGVSFKKLREEDHCENLGVDGRIMIK